MTLLSLEAIYHLYPATQRTFVMQDNTSWSQVSTGEMIDPYYSATYKRVELAGGDYLPYNSPDFRTYPQTIQDQNDNSLTTGKFTSYDKYTFTIITPQEVILPISYYKGYVVQNMDSYEILPTKLSHNGLVSVDITQAGTYTCVYRNTVVRNVSFVLSMITFVIMVLSCMHVYKRKLY